MTSLGLLGLLAGALGGVAEAHIPVLREIQPGDDWCQVIADSGDGDTFQFYPGTYEGPCEVFGPFPDNVGEVLTITSFLDYDPAVFVPGPTGDHVLAISGEAVRIDNVVFAQIGQGTAAIEVEGSALTVARVQVRDAAGVGIRQVGDLHLLEVMDSHFTHTDSVAIQVGCVGCTATDLRLHDNVILGPDVGIQATGGAWGFVRDTRIDAVGAGVLWTGHGVEDTLIEENLILSTADAVRSVDGLVTVRSNVLVGKGLAVGPGVHRWFGNTIDGGEEPLRFEGWSDGVGLDVRNNALSAALVVPAGSSEGGNIACTERCACWLDADAHDYYPSPGSPLVEGGVAQVFGELTADWCGFPRGTTPTVGAFQSVSVLGPGPLELELADETTCLYPPDPEDEPDPCGLGTTPTDSGLPATGTGTGTGGGPRPTPEGSGGCGCTQTGGALGAGMFPWVVVFALIRRRI